MQHPPQSISSEDNCELLGPFALIVQGLMGLLALSSLVWKRSKEYPNRRPWKVWLFDVSKQVLGALGIHMLNVFMSILGGSADDWSHNYDPVTDGVSIYNTIQDSEFNVTVGYYSFEDRHKTSAFYFVNNGLPPNARPKNPPSGGDTFDNPCDYYFLNILFDTTVGIPILWGLLFVIFGLARKSGIEGIESGDYGQPPRYSYYFKQLGLYFVGLLSMKLIIYILLIVCPFLVKIADLLLNWSDDYPNLQVGLVVLVFPLIMNTFQYYVIDNIIQSPEYNVANKKLKKLDEESTHGAHHNHHNQLDTNSDVRHDDLDSENGIGRSESDSIVGMLGQHQHLSEHQK